LTSPSARLTVYFGERGRSRNGLLAEELMGMVQAAGVQSAVLLRGSEGFGLRHGLRTADLLSLSEDLPMTAIASGPAKDTEPLAAKIRSQLDEGLVTVEPCTEAAQGPPEQTTVAKERLPTGPVTTGSLEEAVRLTVWTSRGAKIQGRPASEALVDGLKATGAAAAIALLGVDGIARGVRHRAGFFSANSDVPMLVTAICPAGRRDDTRARLRQIAPDAVIESGELLASGPLESGRPVTGNPAGRALACLAVFGDGLDPESGIHGQKQIVRMLRRRGAPGATARFGSYGYASNGLPHGESFFGLTRRVPVLTEVVDSVENCRRWHREIEGLNLPGTVIVLSPVGALT
jgi:PII-like signaling protein